MSLLSEMERDLAELRADRELLQKRVAAWQEAWSCERNYRFAVTNGEPFTTDAREVAARASEHAKELDRKQQRIAVRRLTEDAQRLCAEGGFEY